MKKNQRSLPLMSLLLFFLVAFSTQAFSQVKTITGTVTNAEDGSTLPGVSVLVKGTTIGTVTDMNGKYTLSVPSDAKTLEFSFVGMVTQNVDIGNQTTIDVQMNIDILGLDEVVVTGYSTQMKEALTGAVSTVKSAQLAQMPVSNAAQKMQGRVSGVTVLDSHVPGGDASVLVRGLGTINNNNPLYVIDGVPTTGGLSQINPNDIESITVLKDASSQAIYGARGANGVIIITTKRGAPGKPQVSFAARGGVSWAANKYNLLNTKEYGELLWLEAKNDGIVPGNQLYGFGSAPVIPDYILPGGAHEGDPSVDPDLYSYNMDHLYLIMKANKQGTDWYKEMEQVAPINEYNLSVSGGTNTTNYAFSAGYMGQQGILLYTGFKRYSIRGNTDTQINKWFKVGQSLGLAYTDGYGNRSDNGEGTVISQGYRMQPIIPVYDIMGNFAGTKAPTTGNGRNPVAILTRDKNDFGKDLRAIGNAYSQITLMKGLNFKSLFGFDYRTGNWKDIFIKDPEFSEAKPTDKLNLGTNYTIQWNWANTLNYNKVFAEKHTVNLLVGTEAVSNSYRWFNAGRTTYFSTDPDYMFLNSGESDQSNSGLGSDWRTFSIFGRLDYDLMGKYMLQATVRRDGSSRFGANHRYGTFPAFSAGWRISKESFMTGTQNWLNYLKLRVGWGQSGNDQIGSYNGFTTFRSNNVNSYYSLTGSNTSTNAGFDSNSIGNPDAKWEATTTTDGGFDATLFGNLTINFDYWKRKTTDMLYPVTMPNVWGQATRPSINIGDMKNVGFDLVMSYNGKASGGDFTYNVSANISHYKNEILKLSDNAGEVIWGSGYRQQTYTKAEVGTAFPEFYGYIVDGIFQTQAEADAYAPAFGVGGTYNEPGHYKFRDVNGDGVIDNNDRTYIGSPHPKFTGGLNVDLGYKGFGISAFFYTSYGNKMVNYVKRWIDFNQFQGNRSKDRLYKSWGSPYLANNADAILPKAQRNDQGDQEPSTAFIEDASYLRLKSLQLSYSLPKSVLNRLSLSTLQIYLQGTNVFTLTKYSGLDPEVRNYGSNMGIDAGAWPTPKQFLIGLKMNF